MNVQFLQLIVIPKYLNSFVFSIIFVSIVNVLFFVFDPFENRMHSVFLWLMFNFHLLQKSLSASKLF